MKLNKNIPKLTILNILLWSFVTILSLTFESTQNNRFKIISVHLVALWIIGITLLYLNFTSKNHIVKIVFLWLAYIILINIFTKSLNLEVFETLIWWPLSFNVFYLIGKNENKLSIEPLIIKNFKIFFIVFYFSVIYSASSIMNNSSSLSISIYYLICLIPVVLIQKPNYKYSFLILIFLASIFSIKRGAFLCITIVLAYLVISEWRNTSKLWNRVLLFAIFGSILANIALTETNFYIIEKINNSQIDEGSGRLDIYQETWQQYLNKPLINQMFGSGHNAVALGYSQASIMEIKSRSAHNDFLEILFDYGITGIAIYLYFIVSLIKVLKKSKQYNKKLYVILISSLLVFFLLSMYSHLNLYPENYIFIVAVWGYYCAQLDSKTSKRKLSFIVDENEIENIPSSRSLPYKKLQIYICK
jgi:hypothetical protein